MIQVTLGEAGKFLLGGLIFRGEMFGDVRGNFSGWVYPHAGLQVLRIVVTICDTLVNTQTHTQRKTDFDRLYAISSAPAELNIVSEGFTSTQYCSNFQEVSSRQHAC